MIADAHGERMPRAKHHPCAFPCTMGGHVPPLLGAPGFIPNFPDTS